MDPRISQIHDRRGLVFYTVTTQTGLVESTSLAEIVRVLDAIDRGWR